MAYPSHIHAFVPPTSLNVTALSASNGASTLECWQIVPDFTTSSQAGTIGASSLQLGGLSNMSYSVIPPGFNASFHNAPTFQYVSCPLSSTHSPILTRLITGKMGCIPYGSRPRHARQLLRRGLYPWREERPHLCGGYRGSERIGPLDELPVELRDHRTANPHRWHHSPAQCATLGPVYTQRTRLNVTWCRLCLTTVR